MDQQEFYTDIDLNMVPNPLTGDIGSKNDVEAIKRSLRTLCSWEKWDVPFSPQIHNYLRDQLFEIPGIMTVSNIKAKIQWLINNFETRVLIKNIDVFINTGENGYEVTIEFIVKSILKEGSVSFTLQRIR